MGMLAIAGLAVLLIAVLSGCAAWLKTNQATPPESGSPTPTATGVEGEGASGFPYKFEEVQAPPEHIRQMLEKTREADKQRGARPDTGYAESYALEDVPNEIRPPLLPSDEALPEGLSLNRAKVHVKQPVETEKNPPNTLVIFHSDEEKQLHLETSPPPPPDAQPVPLAVGKGRVQRSNQVNGHFIQGEWIAKETDNGVELSWEDDFALKLLAFEDGNVIRLKGHPTSSFSEDELLQVAQSLQPYNSLINGA